MSETAPTPPVAPVAPPAAPDLFSRALAIADHAAATVYHGILAVEGDVSAWISSNPAISALVADGVKYLETLLATHGVPVAALGTLEQKLYVAGIDRQTCLDQLERDVGLAVAERGKAAEQPARARGRPGGATGCRRRGCADEIASAHARADLVLEFTQSRARHAAA